MVLTSPVLRPLQKTASLPTLFPFLITYFAQYMYHHHTSTDLQMAFPLLYKSGEEGLCVLDMAPSVAPGT